jgi:hypothetical protein
MILRKIDYHEFDGESNYWALKPFELGKINLLVGKNATGKTNTITKITWLGNMLAGTQLQLLNSCSYDAEFVDIDDVYKYSLKLSFGKVDSERLEINDEEKFVRNKDGIGEIYADELGRKIKFQLPSNQLVAVSRCDAIQHPYLNKLSDWANGLRMYEFGSPLGKNIYFATNDIHQGAVNPRKSDRVVALYVNGKQEFGQDFGRRIISYMKEINYDLLDIGVATVPNTLVSRVAYIKMICLSEKDSDAIVWQPDISQGMFRALSLLIQITYNLMKGNSSTILIDDIGEGLDFDRSSRLIKLLVKIAEENENIQLVMSTNDRFVMNAVPLEYWQVIQRNGGECHVFNYQNSKEKFDEFEYMGLSNFDFLRTDFINSRWENI